jgi:hypothetical protein
LRSRTFFTATSSPWKRPKKTAPWAPEPTHCRSRISSKGTSQRSVGRKHRNLQSGLVTHSGPGTGHYWVGQSESRTRQKSNHMRLKRLWVWWMGRGP